MDPENYVVKGVIRVQIKGFTPRWSRTMNTEQILLIIIQAIISLAIWWIHLTNQSRTKIFEQRRKIHETLARKSSIGLQTEIRQSE